MWESHINFNKWEIKNNKEENNSTNDVNHKRVNIEDIPFL
ncbi:hemolysin [Clostridium botulinum]|nr:hemolysin [Clostridium botulinum]NFQ85114.1 hemolysin [Clostridium sporogenes]MCJ8173978.1 hemolysin [Clostridium botulinum]NCI22002.1 hemolysin [Clostridium botulinum]NCI74327.1 hemolysin [Clostridium botulinum]NDI40577.1 hemolysin [Clostridium botulinum]